MDRLFVVHLGQDHVPGRGPDCGGHHSPVCAERGDKRAVVRKSAACLRIAKDAERQLMLGLARLEERPTNIEERVKRVEAARVDRHRVQSSVKSSGSW